LKTINPETPEGVAFVSFVHAGASFRHFVLEPASLGDDFDDAFSH
jgi:hypothetical protein